MWGPLLVDLGDKWKLQVLKTTVLQERLRVLAGWCQSWAWSGGGICDG